MASGFIRRVLRFSDRKKKMSCEDKVIRKSSIKREAIGETKFADTLILYFHLPDSKKVNFCCLSQPSCGILLW